MEKLKYVLLTGIFYDLLLIKRIPRGFASGFHILSPEFQGRCQPANAG